MKSEQKQKRVSIVKWDKHVKSKRFNGKRLVYELVL
jgi:hypothetical protein